VQLSADATQTKMFARISIKTATKIVNKMHLKSLSNLFIQRDFIVSFIFQLKACIRHKLKLVVSSTREAELNE
jgi:hypothetical protein